MQRTSRSLLIITSSAVVLIIVILIFLSPITKYLLEKYDEKYLGRQVTLNWVYVNPFTGYIHLSGLKVFEEKKDSVFFSAEGVTARIAMIQLIFRKVEITELKITKPQGSIIQDKKRLNFTDLIEKFSPPPSSKTSNNSFDISILNIEISNGVFYYRDKQIPIYYFIKDANFKSSGFRSDNDTIVGSFYFLSGIKSGIAKGNFTLNLKNLNYGLSAVVNTFDLQFLEQYLKDIANYGSFRASLDADIKATGNFKNQENVTANGTIVLNDFHFGKDPKEDYASFRKLTVAIEELSPNNRKYKFDSLSLNDPYFKYERYDHLDNFQTIFGDKGSNVSSINNNPDKFNLIIEIGKYIKVLSKNFFKSNYKINRLAIYNGDLKFVDYSLNEKFSSGLNPLNIIADSINKTNKDVEALLTSGIEPYGSVAVKLSINPKDSSDFDLRLHVRKLPLALFNPYLLKYTSFSLERGSLELNCLWKVGNGDIQSKNHLLILDPKIHRRVNSENNTWVPMRLLMYFARERGNVIDYEIPIKGNLKNPKFKIKDIILDALLNTVAKPVKAPYITKVKMIESEIEKSLMLKWDISNDYLSKSQIQFLKKIADFLQSNPNVSLTIYPKTYTTKEKEYLLYFEAKKKYFLATQKRKTNSLTEDDSIGIVGMYIKDPLFIDYLNKNIKDSLSFTVFDKCKRFINDVTLNAKLKTLQTNRRKVFMRYFRIADVDKQVRVLKNETTIPFDGFSYYRIQYKGVLPEFLINAYQRMNTLNEERPRNKFKAYRKSNRNTL